MAGAGAGLLGHGDFGGFASPRPGALASPLSSTMLKIQSAEVDHSFWFENSGSTPMLGIADIFDDAPMAMAD